MEFFPIYVDSNEIVSTYHMENDLNHLLENILNNVQLIFGNVVFLLIFKCNSI